MAALFRESRSIWFRWRKHVFGNVFVWVVTQFPPHLGAYLNDEYEWNDPLLQFVS